MLHVITLLAAMGAGMILCRLAWHDLRRRRLPNALVLAFGLLYLLFALGHPLGVLSHIAVGFGCLLLGMLLTFCGVMGGGDAKLIGALMLWAGPGYWLQALLITTQTGLFLALLGLAARALLHRNPQSRARKVYRCLTVSRGVPYGVALAVAGAYTIVVQCV
jgi:prepilin peptidase CpaA